MSFFLLCFIKNLVDLAQAISIMGCTKGGNDMNIDAAKLTKRMEELDIKPEELAVAAGCTAPTIYNIKRGRNCNRQTAKRIAAALKCKVDSLHPDKQQPERP